MNINLFLSVSCNNSLIYSKVGTLGQLASCLASGLKSGSLARMLLPRSH